MGAWGTGSFENDDASDWVYELEDAEDLSLIVETLKSVAESEGEYLEAPDCSRALAAAEVVAALRTHQAGSLPDEVAAWLKRHPVQVAEDLLKLAGRAVARIKTDSELKDLWDESGDSAAWRQTIDKLENHLKP